jgi:hypothetical protein
MNNIFTPTPPELLRHIAELCDKLYGSMLDPCAGDGATIEYLSKRWRCSAYGVEQDEKLYHELQNRAKALHDDFGNIKARGFRIVYCFPPPDTSRSIRWTKSVWEALNESAIAVFRFTETVVQYPSWLLAMTRYFEDIQVWRDPIEMFAKTRAYTFRARARISAEALPDTTRAGELAKQIEEANPITVYIRPWDTTGKRQHQGFVFRPRQLEPEDLLEDALNSSWPHVSIPYAKEKVQLRNGLTEWEQKQSEDPNAKPTITGMSQITAGVTSVFTDAYAIKSNYIFFLSMLGRKTHINAVEALLKRGQTIKIGYTRAKLDGGATYWKENYRTVLMKLPNTGTFHAIWIHVNGTGKPGGAHAYSHVDDMVLLPKTSEIVMAQIMSNKSGIPIAPEWVHHIIGKAEVGWDYRIHNLNVRFVRAGRGKLMNILTQAVEDNMLVEPKMVEPDILRPIMPPSAGIWAQLAMQEFINEVPLPGGIIMHAEPIVLEDSEVGEAIDGRVEFVEITRKDCVRVTVFQYKTDSSRGAIGGTFEVFQTETVGEDI